MEKQDSRTEVVPPQLTSPSSGTQCSEAFSPWCPEASCYFFTPSQDTSEPQRTEQIHCTWSSTTSRRSVTLRRVPMVSHRMAWDDSMLLLWLFSEPSTVVWSSQGSLLGQRGLTCWVPLRPRDQCLSEGADGSRGRTKSCCAGQAYSPWDSRNMSYIRQMSWELAGDLLAGTLT